MTKEIKPRASDLLPSDPQYPVFLTNHVFGWAQERGAHMGANHDHIRAIAELVRPVNAETAEIALHGVAFVIRSGERHHRNIGHWDATWNNAADHDIFFSAAQLPEQRPAHTTKRDIVLLGFPVMEFMLESLDEPTGGVVASKLLEPELTRLSAPIEQLFGFGGATAARAAVEQAEQQILWPIGIAMPEASS